jgi:hypothetical protein
VIGVVGVALLGSATIAELIGAIVLIAFDVLCVYGTVCCGTFEPAASWLAGIQSERVLNRIAQPY